MLDLSRKNLRFRNRFGRPGNAMKYSTSSEEWRHWGILISELSAAVCQFSSICLLGKGFAPLRCTLSLSVSLWRDTSAHHSHVLCGMSIHNIHLETGLYFA